MSILCENEAVLALAATQSHEETDEAISRLPRLDSDEDLDPLNIDRSDANIGVKSTQQILKFSRQKYFDVFTIVEHVPLNRLLKVSTGHTVFCRLKFFSVVWELLTAACCGSSD